MSQSAQQFFDVQTQAEPTPFVIHFLQSTVTTLSQTQQTFEVSEWCLGDPRAAVELTLAGLGRHPRSGALTDLFMFVPA